VAACATVGWLDQVRADIFAPKSRREAFAFEQRSGAKGTCNGLAADGDTHALGAGDEREMVHAPAMHVRLSVRAAHIVISYFDVISFFDVISIFDRALTRFFPFRTRPVHGALCASLINRAGLALRPPGLKSRGAGNVPAE